MSKRKLVRQLNLLQLVMLGTAGTIAAEIFVLTGHAVALVGPAAVLALLLGGLLSYSVALNYCELGTAYPVAGGALTYVREAYGPNLLSFLVGSLDCLSSTFYSALSAVGFAYSLRVFAPGLPIVPIAVAIVLVFMVLNLLGVSNVGNVQIVLGGLLLVLLGGFVVGGFILPGGFRWEVLTAGGFFIHRGLWTNAARVLRTMALVYSAYVGFEVIADDAEEVQNPSRNIPLGILISLSIVTVIYVLVVLVVLGTLPWQQVAGSETALTDTVLRFLPGLGVPLMAVAGMIATLTSVNTALLSATREALTLSRDGLWPRALSRLSRLRTPHIAILFIGGITCVIAAIGLVDFLSYISSSGYLFVLFWASLAMIRLRRMHPEVRRPFKVPFFPLTAYLAAATCFLIIASTDWKALLFGVGVIALCTVLYYLRLPLSGLVAARNKALEAAKDRILIPVANPRTAASLIRLATIVARASEDTSICVLAVVPVSPRLPKEVTDRLVARLRPRQTRQLKRIAEQAREEGVPLYSKVRAAPDVASGILHEANGNVKLVLMGWPGPLDQRTLADNPVKAVLQGARAGVAVLLDKGLNGAKRILVPVGGGPHSRLAVRLAYEIAEQEGARLTALHCYCDACGSEELQDRMLQLREIIEDELGDMPPQIITRLAHAECVPDGILREAVDGGYDLMVIGASDEWASRTRLFGSVDDLLADRSPCSVLFVRRYESATVSWLRRRVKLSVGEDDA